MSPLSPARRDAEAFAVAVEDPTRAADRYADLLECVGVLREQEVPAPRADFVADLRMRLMDAADTLLLPEDGARIAPVVPIGVSPATRRQRRISVAAAAFVVIGGTAGVAAAAENALPGDALYPLKRGIESAQVSLNSSDAGKGQDLLRVANTRLSEVDGLISEDQGADQITATLSSFTDSAADGADLLFVDYQRNGDTDRITELRAMLGSQLARLDTLAADAPAGAQAAFTKARALLSDLDQQASVICGDCGHGISDRFTAASAPSLASLLSAPALTDVRAADSVQPDSELANRAGDIADKIKKHNQATSGGAQTPLGSDPAKPGVPLPTPDPDGLGNVVNGLTSGVSTLLQGVGGTVLAPLTDAVDDTLETLTGGLLGK